MKINSIFIDGHVLDDKYQGSKTYLLGILDVLVKLLPETKFYIGCKSKILESDIFNQNNVFHIQYKSKNNYSRLLFEIPKILKGLKPDFAWFQYISPPFIRIKSIVTIHDLLPIDFPELFSGFMKLKVSSLFRFSALNATLVLTVSEYSKDRLVKHFKLDKKLIVVTPNAVHPGFSYNIDENQVDNQLKNLSNCKYILYVSRLEERKNQKALIEAFGRSNFKKNNFKLILVGSDDDATDEIRCSLKNELVIHYVNISNNDLSFLYKYASGFVYPSKAEGFGIPPLEAALFRIPVLCSNQTAMADFVDFHPYHMSLNSRDEILEGLNSFYDYIINPNSLNDREEIIAQNICQKYSWNNSAKILLEAIKSI